QIDKDFDYHQCGIQDAICIKNEGDRHSEGRKSVPNGPIHKRRKESNSDKDDHTGVKGRHLLSSQIRECTQFCRSRHATDRPHLKQLPSCPQEILYYGSVVYGWYVE